MEDKEESAEVRKANLHFRKEKEAKEGAVAWAEHLGHDAVRDKKTAGLKAQRMARDAAAPPAPAKKPKGGRKAAVKKIK